MAPGCDGDGDGDGAATAAMTDGCSSIVNAQPSCVALLFAAGETWLWCNVVTERPPGNASGGERRQH